VTVGQLSATAQKRKTPPALKRLRGNDLRLMGLGRLAHLRTSCALHEHFAHLFFLVKREFPPTPIQLDLAECGTAWDSPVEIGQAQLFGTTSERIDLLNRAA
jgi:hypothetical protein